MRPRHHPGLICICLVLAATIAWLLIGENSGSGAGSHATARHARPDPRNQVSHGAMPPRVAGLLPVAKQGVPAESIEVPDDFLKRAVSKDGKTLTLQLPGGPEAKGNITTNRQADGQPVMVQGEITHPEPGRFMFQRQTVKGVAGDWVGFLYFHKSDVAWKVRPIGNDGKCGLFKTTADQVICRAYPVAEGPEEIPPTHPTDYPIPPDENGIIQLQSLPGATGVVYLDFDGEERHFDSWGYYKALPSQVNNAQIYEVWKGVSEDYQPFNLNITTIRAVYDAAPEGRRIQVVVTPTTDPSPGAGGVAFVGSFNWSGEMVCWSFYSSGKNAVEVISHEVGHTLGLAHHGTNSSAYYLGHNGWAPIMGAGYYQTPSQWSKGEYPDAYAATFDGLQDDLEIISTTNNDVAYRDDDHGDAYANATWLDIAMAGTVSNEGAIETAADEDSFRFSTGGGTVDLMIENVVSNPNLDLKAEILDSGDNIIATSDPSGSLDASFTALALPAGDYFLRISGVGVGDTITGYTDYASLGAYTITGTVPGGVHADQMAIDENAPNGSTIGTVAPRADHGAGVPEFSIASGNTGATFAIDSSTGVITIADNLLLDFEQLSTRWDDPSTFELFILITDSLGVATETIRTVITIGDANEPPDFPAPLPVTIAEHLTNGTVVTTATATDPDRTDHITYSIEGGNTGSAFAIDPATGVITAAGSLHFETTPSYTLTLRATDNRTPPNFIEVPLAINLIDIGEDYVPGTLVRTFYDDIAGSTVASLISSPNFPNKPHSEETLTSFDSLASKGDSYGSTMRGYVIAPATGNYTFWISSDDGGELWISADANPNNAVVRATVPNRTDPEDWTAYPSQQSTAVAMVAGQAYYIEARQKDNDEGDHVQVAWQGPGVPTLEIVPGRWLAPFHQDYAPWAADQSLVVRGFANNGQRIGHIAFVEPDGGESVASYAITSGNELGIFAIDPVSGDITVADDSLLFIGDIHILVVSATDDGVAPLTGSATITIPVLGLHEQLHAWWKLDEGSGTIITDSSGNSRQANLTGGGSWFTRDAANPALQLNGTNARLTYPGNNAFAGDTAFSVAAWVRVPPSHSTDAVLVQQQESGSLGQIGRYLVRVKPDGRVNFSLYGKDATGGNEGFQFDITSTGSIDDGTWHHVTCVRNGESGSVFIDGIEQASGSGVLRMMEPTLTVAVGCDARNNNSFLNAAVDDIRFYHDALGSQQILRIAGTPKVAITSPSRSTADIPDGVGLMLTAVASDPDGPPPGLSWSQVSGPGIVDFGSPSSAGTSAVFSEPGTYVLRVTADDGTNSAHADVSVLAGVTASSPFDGLTYGGGSPGSHFSAGPDVHILIGGSSGINEASAFDGFYQLGQAFSGDFDIRARVNSLSDVAGTTAERAGIIMRVGTAGAPDEISSFVGFGSTGTAFWIRRANLGANNLSTEYAAQPVPGWCRIKRSGGIVEFMHSDDGVSWTTRGVNILNGEVRAGLCWSSGNPFGTGSAMFENVSGFSTGNIGPLVNAGDDGLAVANLPADLTGSISDDGLPLSPGTTTVSWQLVEGPAGVTFGDSALPATTATCHAEGNFFIRLVADDGEVRTFDETTFTASLLDTIGVEATDAVAGEDGPDPGTFTFTRGGSIIGDLTIDFILSGTATNGDDYQLLAESILIPDGVATAEITVTPILDLPVESAEIVTLTIVPGAYDITSDSAAVMIMDSNHTPEWSASPIAGNDGDEDLPYVSASLAGSATDPDGNPLVFSKTSGPEWLAVASDGSLSGTPGAADAGPNSFGVRVTDSGGLFADAVFEVFVVFANQAPSFNSDPIVLPPGMAQIPYTGQSLVPSTTDVNLVQGDVVSFSKLTGPSWLSIAPTGELSGTPDVSDLGLNEFTVRVTDAAGSIDEALLQITVGKTVLHLDANGSTPGSGFTGPLSWDSSSIWSADPDGAAATYPWIEGAEAVFSAGIDAAPGTITLDGLKTVSAVKIEEGPPVLTGGGLVLTETQTPFEISDSAILESPISGTGLGLEKTGAGLLVLAGANTFTGDTAITSGVLELTTSGRLYNAAPEGTAVISILTGGTLRLPDFSVAGSGQLAEDRERIVLNGGTLEVTGTTHSSTRNFTVTAVGGTLRHSAPGQTLTLDGNPTDDILIQGNLTVDNMGDVVVNELLEGSGSLVKTGLGMLTLAAPSPLSGNVIVTAGTLHLSGSLASTGLVDVSAGGVLTGGGTITNGVAISAIIAPGDGVGTLNVGDLSLLTGSTLQWQAGDWTSPSGQDRIQANSVDLTASTGIILELYSESIANFANDAASFILIETTSGISGFDAENFIIDANGFPEATGQWQLRLDGNNLMLDYSPLGPFELWQIAEFGPDAGNPSIAGEAADPDYDGMDNLTEYALLQDPNVSGPSPIVMDLEDVAGTDYLRLTITKNPEATDVMFTVQTTGDLTNPMSWTDADTLIESDTPTELIVRDTLSSPPRFIRLKLER